MIVLVLTCAVFGPSVLSSSVPVCYLKEYTGLYYNPQLSKYPVTEARIVRKVRSHQPDQCMKEENPNLQKQEAPTLVTQGLYDSDDQNKAKRALPFSKIITYDTQKPYYCPICNEPLILHDEHSSFHEEPFSKSISRSSIRLPSQQVNKKLTPAEQFLYELSQSYDKHSSEQSQLDRLNNPQKLYDIEMKLLEGKLPNWEELNRLNLPKKSLVRKPSRAEKKSKLTSKLQPTEAFQAGFNYSTDDDDFYSDSSFRYGRQVDSTINPPPVVTKTIKTEETAVLSKTPNGDSKQPRETIVLTKNVEEIETNTPRRLIEDKSVTENPKKSNLMEEK